MVAEGVRVVVHPREQGGSGRLRVGARSLTGLDPAADDILGELTKAAAGIIELLGFGMAARKKGFL